MKKITINPSFLSKNGQGQRRRKVTKAGLWTTHEVDQDPLKIGKRYATRVAGSARTYGMANGYDHLEAVDFMYGEGIIPGAGAVIKDALSGKTVAVARIADAMAYKIAAIRRGVELEVYNVA